MAFLRKIRLRIAGALTGKNFGKIKTSGSLKPTISRWMPRSRKLAEWIRPKGKRLSEGMVRVPKQVLSQEAQDAVARIWSGMRYAFQKRAITMAPPALLVFTIVKIIEATTNQRARSIWKLQKKLAYKEVSKTEQTREDIAFLQDYLRKTYHNNPWLRKRVESHRYQYFTILDGELVMTTDMPTIAGLMPAKNVIVADDSRNVVYKGPERRWKKRRNPTHDVVDES